MLEAACPSFETWLWESTSPFNKSEIACCYGLQATASSSAFQPTCLAFRPSVLPAARQSWGSALAFLLFSPSSLALQSATGGERWPVALINGSSKAAEAPQIWNPTCTSGTSFCHLNRCSCCAGQGCMYMKIMYAMIWHLKHNASHSARADNTYIRFLWSIWCMLLQSHGMRSMASPLHCVQKQCQHEPATPTIRIANVVKIHKKPILSHSLCRPYLPNLPFMVQASRL